VLQALRDNGKSFTAFGLHQSEQHAAYFRSHPPSAQEVARFTDMARLSILEQEELERSQTGSFDDYVKAYRASNLCPNHCT
jgi:glutamate--cysteine ligase